MGKERGVGGKVHHVGVALQPGHEGSLGEGGQEIVGLARGVVVGSILAGKDFGAAAVVAVITGGIGKEPVGGHVVVLVHQVHTDAFHLGPEVVELVTIGVGAGGADNLDVGIAGADGFGKDFQTLGIDLIPLFVTDANHLEVERLRMSHLGTQLSPGGSNGAIGEFDKVEGILHVGV